MCEREVDYFTRETVRELHAKRLTSENVFRSLEYSVCVYLVTKNVSQCYTMSNKRRETLLWLMEKRVEYAFTLATQSID